METAAERYRRIKTERAANETLHPVDCPECGMTWQCRRVGLEFWVSSGLMPLHLAEMFVKMADKAVADGTARKLAGDEVMQSIVFSNKVVMHTAADPKIVETPKEPNEIGQDEVELCCYKRLRDWQMKGGDEAASLSNFPAE